MKAAVATMLGSALLCAACGRTPLLPPYCHLHVDPVAIDFGGVLPGGSSVRQVRVANDGGAACTLSQISITDASSPWFTLSVGTPDSVALAPGSAVDLSVSFVPDIAAEPFTRTGQLAFTSNGRGQARVAIPLTGRVKSSCSLGAAPAAIDFGLVPLGASPTRTVTLTNLGVGPCSVADLAIAPHSDPQFFLAAPLPAPAAFTLAPGQSGNAEVGFTARDRSPPHQRTGQLGMTSNDEDNPAIAIALSANIDVGCQLTWSPAKLDFGLAILNTQTSAAVTLANGGTRTCNVSGLDLTADSDPDFTLADTQARSFSVAAGDSGKVTVVFTAADSAPPHGKSGMLIFETGEAENPNGRVPLAGYVSTVCIEASRWVYTVDGNGLFSRFDPSTLTFTDIGTLRCPGESQGPNSMAVDQDAVAWVSYHDGNLFKVDTATAKCEATSFVPNQSGLWEFGMGFVFDPSTGEDQLYIAGTAQGSHLVPQATLATIAFPSLTVTPIGAVTSGNVELTGTGDGQLWGFAPDRMTADGKSILVRIDPATGQTLESHRYSSLSSTSAASINWAVKFWGGSFWIFFNDSVYRVERDDLDVIHTALSNTRRFVVGAGVSTCAPLR